MHGRQVFNFCCALNRYLLAMLAFIAASAVLAKTPLPPDAVSVKVGKTISVMFQLSGDRLVSPTPLPNPVDGESVVTLKLEQSGPSCTLYITNGFGKTLTYRTMVRFRGKSSMEDMPAVPVRPYREGVMSFAARVEEIVIYELRITE